MRKSVLWGAAALAMISGSASAAGTFTYGSYDVVGNTNVVITGGTEPGTYGSGQIDLIGAGANAGTTLKTWCIDASDELLGSGADTIISSGFNNHGGDLSGLTLNGTTLGEIGALIHYGDVNINQNDVSPAVQLAIWTVEYAGLGYSFTSSDSNVNSMVSTLVSDVSGPQPLLAAQTNFQEVIAVDGNGHSLTQGLAFEVSPVPVPAALPLFGSAFAGLGAISWRRRNRKAA